MCYFNLGKYQTINIKNDFWIAKKDYTLFPLIFVAAVDCYSNFQLIYSLRFPLESIVKSPPYALRLFQFQIILIEMCCELMKITVKYVVGLLSIWLLLTTRLAVIHSEYAVDKWATIRSQAHFLLLARM